MEKNRKDPLTKTIPSKIFNTTTQALTGVKLNDINCGYKAYNPELAKKLVLHGELHRYIPVIVSSMGYTITELPVHHRPRLHGKSKYNWTRLLGGFFDLATVLYITKFQDKPLHIFGFTGLVLFILGSSIASYLTFIKFIFNQKIGERPLLLLAILLIIIGVQISIFGLIGEQIAHITYKNYYDPNIKKISKAKKTS